MTTSGSYDFTVTRDELITLAHQHIGVVGEGESCTANQVTEAAKLLNLIVKLRAGEGMPAWSLKRGFILPFSDASSIATNSHCVTSYDSTTLSADAASAATAITITAAGNTANSDEIGVEQDDGTILWTTISSGGGTTSITLASALTDDAASGNRVYYYTASADRIQKPIRILQVNTLNVANSTSTEIDLIGRVEYFNLTNRTQESDPLVLFYDISSTSATSLDTGSFYIWPRFQNGDTIIEFVYQRPFQDFDASTDNPDFPQAFHLPLMLELAAMIGPKFGVDVQERARLFSEAKMYREEAFNTIDAEDSLFIQPDVGGMR
jgi:hypothetical protein